jgi:hypothetical protein
MIMYRDLTPRLGREKSEAVFGDTHVVLSEFGKPANTNTRDIIHLAPVRELFYLDVLAVLPV